MEELGMENGCVKREMIFLLFYVKREGTITVGHGSEGTAAKVMHCAVLLPCWFAAFKAVHMPPTWKRTTGTSLSIKCAQAVPST